MRLASWNVERLHNKALLGKILDECGRINADILVLTETDTRVKIDKKYACETPLLTGIEDMQDYYKPTENRVTIITDYKAVRYCPTYDKFTANYSRLL